VSDKLGVKKFRKLVPSRCHSCGRQFFIANRAGRRRLFCDDACRQATFRNGGYYRTARNEIAPKSATNSKPYKAIFGDRPLPLNILGGYRWPDSVPVDRKVLAKIIRAEIGEVALDLLATEQP
jgi:hypothetical protein